MIQGQEPRKLSGDELAAWLAHFNEADDGNPVDGAPAAEARMIYDSTVPEGMAVRSLAQSSTSRQLAFSTAVGDVALHIVSFPRTKEVDLHGQFLDHRDAHPGAVWARLIMEGGLGQSAEADDLGEFSFPGVVPGHYRLLLKVEQMSILIPALDLAA